MSASEYGNSFTHRVEAGRLSAVVHDGVTTDRGGNLGVPEAIHLALLHAVLAVADELATLREMAQNSGSS